MRDMQEFGKLLPAAEVAERLDYSERYVWTLGREGVLPRVKVPGRKYVRFRETDVDRARGRPAARPDPRASGEDRHLPVLREERHLHGMRRSPRHEILPGR